MGIWVASALGANVAQGAMPAPVAPPMVGGIVDARAQLVFVEGEKGEVEALDLERGKLRWSSRDGRWPLHAGLGVVAVAAPDPERANVVRIRLLKLADGSRHAESPPLALPSWVIVDPDRALRGSRDATSFSITAWAPRESRRPNRDSLSGYWRIRWKASRTPVYGYRLPDPAEAQRAEGMLLLDQSTATTRPAAVEDPPGTVAPAMPPGFIDAHSLYWSWSEHGSAWSSTPRVFPVAGSGVWAFLSVESSSGRVALQRYRAGESFTPVPLGADGPSTYPVISEDGRYLVLIVSPPGKSSVVSLHDLVRGGGRPVRLPAFRPGFQARIAVVGSLLFYVSEHTGMQRGGGSRTDRTLVALDWTRGGVKWTHALAPRLQAPPVPGAGPR